MKISKIFLYDEPSVPEIKINKLAEFIKNTFNIEVEIRKNIFSFADREIFKQIAACRIYKIQTAYQKHEPLEEEIQYEEQNIENSPKAENITWYDGFEFQKTISKLIPPNEIKSEYFHLIITNRFTCTYDYNDYRNHGRAVICSNPAIISTTGIIEAPAKPREYYMDMMTKFTQGLNIESIQKKYQGTYLEYHDQRLELIIQGYAMQAIFYYLTGESFCELLDCRLNNAHWQKDLLYSQLEVGKLCQRHQRILEDLVKDLN